MSSFDMMEFPFNDFLMVRLEYVLLRDDELQAKIMRIIESWMSDQKRKWMQDCAQAASDNLPEPPEPDYYVTLSYAQIMAQLYMFNSARKGEGKEIIKGKKNAMHRNTLAKAIGALIMDGYVLTRSNPNKTKEFDATQYTLNCPLIQKHMQLLPKNPMSYIGSNGRIDRVPCPDFSNPPQEIPCTKFVHGGGCNEIVHGMQQKSASPRNKKVHGDAQKSSYLIDSSNRFSNRLSKEGEEGGVGSQESETTLNDSSCSSSQNIENKNLGDEGTQQPTQPEENREGEKKEGTTPTPRVITLPEYAPETHQLAKEIATQIYIDVSPHLLKVVETYRTTPNIDLKMIASEALDFIQSARNKKKTQMSASFLERSIKFQIEKATSSPVPGSGGLSYSTGLQSSVGTPLPKKTNNLHELYAMKQEEKKQREQEELAMKGASSL